MRKIEEDVVHKPNHAFTMLELLVVSLILSILALVSLNSLASAKLKSEMVKVKSDLLIVRSAILSYRIDYGRPPNTPEAPLYFLISQLSVAEMSMLTTPISYLNSIPISPWYGKNTHLYNLWVSSRYEENLRASKRKLDFKTEPIPDYFYREGLNNVNTNRDWLIWSNGPTGVSSLEFYNITNGLLSKGGIFCDDNGFINSNLLNG